MCSKSTTHRSRVVVVNLTCKSNRGKSDLFHASYALYPLGISHIDELGDSDIQEHLGHAFLLPAGFVSLMLASLLSVKPEYPYPFPNF